MVWKEQDYPKFENDRFTFKNKETDNTRMSPDEIANTLFANTREQEEEKRKKQKRKNELLDILGDRATSADILLRTPEELEKRIEEVKGKPTGYAASSNIQQNNSTGDLGFDKSPWNLAHYYKISKEYDKEVGDFLHKNTTNPKYYSNDIRHQYVSAIFARNLGEKAAKVMGELNEIKDIQSEPGDSDIDRINNEIGRKYAKLYPNMPRQELLKLMLKDHSKNQKLRIQKMQEKNKRNLDREYM